MREKSGKIGLKQRIRSDTTSRHRDMKRCKPYCGESGSSTCASCFTTTIKSSISDDVERNQEPVNSFRASKFVFMAAHVIMIVCNIILAGILARFLVRTPLPDVVKLGNDSYSIESYRMLYFLKD